MKTRLIVLGDTIVDQYAACEAIGMSAEAPVVVVRELKRRNFIGGAAVVAALHQRSGSEMRFHLCRGSRQHSRGCTSGTGSSRYLDGMSTDRSRPPHLKAIRCGKPKVISASAGSKNTT